MDKFRKDIIDAIEQNLPEKLLQLAVGCAYHLKKKNVWNILSELISICKVVFSESISSVSIGLKFNKFYLWFNRKFVHDYIFTPKCLIFVLMHELMHKIHGDLFKKFNSGDISENNILANIAFDLYINRNLYYDYFNNDVNLLGRLYANSSEILLKILAPPECFSKIPLTKLVRISKEEKLKQVQNLLTVSIDNKNVYLTDKILELYSAVWFDNSSVTNIFNMLLCIKNILFSKNNKLEYIIDKLIGYHNRTNESEWIKWFKDRINKYFSKTGGYSEDVNSFSIVPQEKNITKFYNAVISALSPDCMHPILKEKLLSETGFIPFPGRKEAFMLSCGWYPLFYPNPIIKRDFNDWRVYVYIDVSGSTQQYWNILYGLILAVKDIIGLPVYGFSNQVFPLTAEDIKHGIVKTTGGTDFDCIVKHAIENRFKRILVITDGCMRITDTASQIAKHKLEVFAIFTDEEIYSSSLFGKVLSEKEENKKWWCMPEIFR